MKALITITILFSSFVASASISDCKDLHIGRIWVKKGEGVFAVVYLNNRGDSSGSYRSNFSGWTPEEKKAALSTLMTAKASNHRVNVETENEDKCGIQAGSTVTKSIYLTTNP